VCSGDAAFLSNYFVHLLLFVTEDDDGEEVFSDEEFEAEMTQKQRQTVPSKHSQV